MKATRSFENSETFRPKTGPHIPEDFNLPYHHRKNFKYHMNTGISLNDMTADEPHGRIHPLSLVAEASSQRVHQGVRIQRHQPQGVPKWQREAATAGSWTLYLQVITRCLHKSVKIVLSHLGENVGWGCSKIEWRERYWTWDGESNKSVENTA